MEKRDREQIENFAKTDHELRTLLRTDAELCDELGCLERRTVLTPADQSRKKELQKQKLAGKDRMYLLLARHRRSQQRRGPGEATA